MRYTSNNQERGTLVPPVRDSQAYRYGAHLLQLPVYLYGASGAGEIAHRLRGRYTEKPSKTKSLAESIRKVLVDHPVLTYRNR